MTTNEEWLKSLNTEELTEQIIGNDNDCIFCIYKVDYCEGDCTRGIFAWLKQERAIDDRD